MKKDFWLERWKQEEIGFHQNEINPYLSQYWSELNAVPDSLVFVPLCGKSRDMLWIREQNQRVLGVELSPIAVQAFFEDNGYKPEHDTRERFDLCSANGISILCGDFFDLTKDDLSGVSVVYDRASLVALPVDMRERYAKHLACILPPATKILLITFDYPQMEMNGPPFSVTTDEVVALYREYADVNLLAQLDVLSKNPNFQARGLSALQENIFLLTLNQK